MSISPVQQKKLKRLALAIEQKEVGLLTVIDEVENALESKIEAIESQLPALREAKDGDSGKDGRDGRDGINGKDGKDYILTEKDKQEISKSITVPIVEKVIEKTEVIKEQPITITEIKEVATLDDALVGYLEEKIDNLAKTTAKINYKVSDGIGLVVRGIRPGTGVTIDDSNQEYPIINASGGVEGATTWGAITGTLSAQTDLQTALNSKANALGSDDNYVTDTEKTKLANLSGINTGDQDLSGYALTTHNHAGVYAPALGADDNYVTDAEKAALHSHSNKAVLDAITASYTTAEASKLAGISAGAEVNVNADWNAVSGDAQILNKPTISGINTGDQIIKDVFGITVDGSGVVLTTGTKGYRYIEQNCTITGWNIQADVSGSVVFDVKRSGVSLAGSEKPTLSGQQSNSDTSLSTWTTSLSAGDIIEFTIDSAATITRATLTILITKI